MHLKELLVIDIVLLDLYSYNNYVCIAIKIIYGLQWFPEFLDTRPFLRITRNYGASIHFTVTNNYINYTILTVKIMIIHYHPYVYYLYRQSTGI